MLSIATGLSRAGARVPIILPTSLKRHEVSSVRHEGEELTHRPSSPAFGFERNQLILNQFPQYLWDTHKRSLDLDQAKLSLRDQREIESLGRKFTKLKERDKGLCGCWS